MLMGISTIGLSIVFGLVLLIIYFTKKRINSTETKIYNVLIVLGVLGLIIELVCCYTTANSNKLPLIALLSNRLWLIHINSWLYLFTYYIFTISFKVKNKKNLSKVKFAFIFSYIISVLAVTTLPLYYYYENDIVYSYGASTNYLVFVASLCIIFWIVSIILNYKKVELKKYIPIFSLFVCVAFALVVRLINPGFLVISISLFLVTFIMYFTIENPDVKTIEELRKSKDISNNSNMEKSMFLFNVTRNIKKPISEIYELSTYLEDAKDLKEVKEYAKEIRVSSNNIYNLMNSVLDISAIAVSKLDIKNNKYNVENLLKETALTLKNNSINKNVKLDITISNDIPTFLYGDGVRLKQVINIALNNAIKYTDKGTITYRVSTVRQKDSCRLLIVVEDTGCGMTADQISSIINSKDLSLEEIEKMESKNEHLTIGKMILDLIGGTLVIDSSLNQGTKVTIVIDQKIADDNSSLSKYTNNKKVLFVDDNEKETKKLTKILEDRNIDLSVASSGESCLVKLRKGEVFDIIIIKEDMEKLSGLATIKRLNIDNSLKAEIVLIVDSITDVEKQAYLRLGIKDFIYTSKSKKEIEQQIEKILN